MNKKMILAGAALATGAALTLAPTAAMAATPAVANSTVSISQAATPVTAKVGAISTPTATVVTHAPYGKVYQLRGNISGAKAGDWVRILNSQNQPVPGFRAFQLSSAISNYTVYFTPGSMGGTYKVKIGNQTSGGVYLAPLTSQALRGATAGVALPTGGA